MHISCSSPQNKPGTSIKRRPVSFRHHSTLDCTISQHHRSSSDYTAYEYSDKDNRKLDSSCATEQNMALQSRYGESIDLVSNMTRRRVSAMEIFVRGQYEDTLQGHGDTDELVDTARSKALEKTRLSIMLEHTVVGPDGKMKPVSAEFYVQYMLRRMWFVCCHDQCGIDFKDVPAFPIKLWNTDEDAEGPRAPEHIREIRIKEQKDQCEKAKAERAEEEKAKTRYRSGLEAQHRREIQELTVAHVKEIQYVRDQALLEIERLKVAVGQHQLYESRRTRQE